MKRYNINRGKQIFFIVGIAALCAAAATSVSAATLKGNVRYAGARVEKKTVPVTIDQYLCGKEKEAGDLVLSSTSGIRNVVVSLHGVPAGSKAPANGAPAKMDQKQCVFVPRVVVVPVGGTVEFLNSDRLLHNVRGSGKENPPFNRAQPHARTISIVFKSPEILRVDCDLHSWMRGWIVVAEHPFYAVTNEEGEFVFENVPPGKYKLQAWQETLGRANQEVTVAGEGTQTITVRMEKK
ncbi:MAG TPA: carboxypeptidase regulatory-like domain-containing protein [Candidatus Binatia bacterium]|jgi:plastocyanin|nr:carboxypeptidase regulatory-like domain-containing protein [Candidatus Binatia bacterium]